MANSAQSRKRARQNDKRRLRNTSLGSKLRTFIKNVRSLVLKGELEGAQTAYKKTESVIDSMVNKKIIHKNTAARQKSRLNAAVKKLANS